jgi:hypothetical protein
VETLLDGDGLRLSDPRPFDFTLSAQDAEDIRWYLKDYRIYPVDPQPAIARRIEPRIKGLPWGAAPGAYSQLP